MRAADVVFVLALLVVVELAVIGCLWVQPASPYTWRTSDCVYPLSGET